MKIIYANCRVKNYMKEDHHSYRGTLAKRKPGKIKPCTDFHIIYSQSFVYFHALKVTFGYRLLGKGVGSGGLL